MNGACIVGTCQHKAGELAYMDTFAGLVPCKVVKVPSDPTGRTGVTVVLTATRGAYRQGERIETEGSRTLVVPRSHVRGLRSTSGPRIVGGYRWAP